MSTTTTATTTARAARVPPAPLKFYVAPSVPATTSRDSLAVPAMPDVFVFAPDGESSFCAFSSGHRPRSDASAFGEPTPSPSAPDFAELDRALEFLSRGVEEMSPRRRRVQRRVDVAQDDVLTWLHDVDKQECQSADAEDELVKPRAPVAESPTSTASTPQTSPPAPQPPSRGLRSKASLVFKRAFAPGKEFPADSLPAAQSRLPRASTSTWDLVLPPSPPANTNVFNAWETRRPKSRLFSSFFSSSTPSDKPRTSKPSIFKRPKKNTQPDTHVDRTSAICSPKFVVDVSPKATPTQSLRRPFSALVLGSYSAKSTVKFPLGKRSSVRETSHESPSPTSSRDTKASTATAVSSASTPYGDPEISSSASSSVTTLGNELVTPVSAQPLHGFHTKRLDSLHFDSATFWDPTSYSFTTR